MFMKSCISIENVYKVNGKSKFYILNCGCSMIMSFYLKKYILK